MNKIDVSPEGHDVNLVTYGNTTIMLKDGEITITMYGDDDEVRVTGNTGTVRTVPGSDVTLVQDGDGQTIVNGGGETTVKGGKKTTVIGVVHVIACDDHGNPIMAAIPVEGEAPTMRVWSPKFKSRVLFELTGQEHAQMVSSGGAVGLNLNTGDMSLRCGETQLTASGNSLMVRQCDDVTLCASGTANITAHTVQVSEAVVVDVDAARHIHVRAGSADVYLPDPNGQSDGLLSVEQIVQAHAANLQAQITAANATRDEALEQLAALQQGLVAARTALSGGAEGLALGSPARDKAAVAAASATPGGVA